VRGSESCRAFFSLVEIRASLAPKTLHFLGELQPGFFPLAPERACRINRQINADCGLTLEFS
jgi:hypothetical protein